MQLFRLLLFFVNVFYVYDAPGDVFAKRNSIVRFICGNYSSRRHNRSRYVFETTLCISMHMIFSCLVIAAFLISF